MMCALLRTAVRLRVREPFRGGVVLPSVGLLGSAGDRVRILVVALFLGGSLRRRGGVVSGGLHRRGGVARR